jgi:hypothetical protein
MRAAHEAAADQTYTYWFHKRNELKMTNDKIPTTKECPNDQCRKVHPAISSAVAKFVIRASTLVIPFTPPMVLPHLNHRG